MIEEEEKEFFPCLVFVLKDKVCMESRISFIRSQLLEGSRLKQELAEKQAESIKKAADIIIHALRSGAKILLCGNGGSAADSQHIAAELVGRFQMDRKALSAIALTTDTSILTAVANDFGYENVFRRQVEAIGKKGDVLIGISTSGGSRNVILAMKSARELYMATIALTGSSEGSMQGIADVIVRIPSKNAARIQEGHIAVGHIFCDLAERYLFETGISK